MREIKFRGKTKDNWVYGYYKYNPIQGSHIIIETGGLPPTLADPGGSFYYEEYEVNPETIGEFTGLHDKNGKEIYEGDIINYENGYYVISWDVTGFIYGDDNDLFDLVDEQDNIEIIGNKFENPELLEQGKENE